MMRRTCRGSPARRRDACTFSRRGRQRSTCARLRTRRNAGISPAGLVASRRRRAPVAMRVHFTTPTHDFNLDVTLGHRRWIQTAPRVLHPRSLGPRRSLQMTEDRQSELMPFFDRDANEVGRHRRMLRLGRRSDVDDRPVTDDHVHRRARRSAGAVDHRRVVQRVSARQCVASRLSLRTMPPRRR